MPYFHVFMYIVVMHNITLSFFSTVNDNTVLFSHKSMGIGCNVYIAFDYIDSSGRATITEM